MSCIFQKDVLNTREHSASIYAQLKKKREVKLTFYIYQFIIVSTFNLDYQKTGLETVRSINCNNFVVYVDLGS